MRPAAPPIRHRLFPILILGVITSALSLAALVQLLTTTTKQRVERASDLVAEEVDRVARDPVSVVDMAPHAVVGMRAGLWDERGRSDGRVPASWRDAIDGAAHATLASGKREIVELHEPGSADGYLVIAARPAEHATAAAYAAYAVRPIPSIHTWQWIVGLLAAATGLLVATSAYAIVTFQKSAASLRASLASLARDLDAPVARPALRELSDVADGIAGLADSLRRARAEEARLNRELARQERLAALGRVVAGVAHEVRNPLASIKLRLDLAAAGAALPPIASDAIANASSEIARLDRLVADLLVLSGRASGPRALASLGALVRERAFALAPWSRERGVTVDVEGDAQATVHADAIARAVDNLLRNAVEAAGATTGAKRVVARVSTRAGQALVRVEDRGVGVAADRVSELFEPFFTTKAEGTGLGLALSRAIARQHGGDVTYAREDGATCFELAVPAGDAGAARAA